MELNNDDLISRAAAIAGIDKCEMLHYCPEKHGCGKYPGRME